MQPCTHPELLRIAFITCSYRLGCHHARRHGRREPHHLAACSQSLSSPDVWQLENHSPLLNVFPLRASHPVQQRRSTLAAHPGRLKAADNAHHALRLPRPHQPSRINRSILRAALSVGAAGIIVKFIATFKEIAVASVYGRADAMDAFLAAALIPSLLVNLISESMNQALVPTLIRVREQEGRERAQQLLSSSMLWHVSAAGCRFCSSWPLARASHLPAHRVELRRRRSSHLPIRLFYALLSSHSSHRHRYQLHCRPQHARSFRASGARAGRHLDLDHLVALFSSRRRLRHLGHGLRNARRLAASRRHCRSA